MHKIRCSFKKLSTSHLAGVMTRLAAASNDLSSARLIVMTASLGGPEVGEVHAGRLGVVLKDNDLRAGLQAYGFRLMLGHLREGLGLFERLIKLEKTDRVFPKLLQRAGPAANDSYSNLKLLCKTRNETDQFNRYIRDPRNKVSFHYESDDTLFVDAIRWMADAVPPSAMGLVLTQDVMTSRLAVADTIVTNALCKLIWGVEGAATEEREENVNTAIEWCLKMSYHFDQFSQHICHEYFAEFSVTV